MVDCAFQVSKSHCLLLQLGCTRVESKNNPTVGGPSLEKDTNTDYTVGGPSLEKDTDTDYLFTTGNLENVNSSNVNVNSSHSIEKYPEV
jgi:hypothetical protein